MHFNSYFSCTVYPAKVGIKMYALCFVFHLSYLLFIAVPTNAENLKPYTFLWIFSSYAIV